MSLILIGFFITISLALIGINLQILHKALDKVNMEYSTGNDKLFSRQERIRKWCFINIIGFVIVLIVSIIELTFFSIKVLLIWFYK